MRTWIRERTAAVPSRPAVTDPAALEHELREAYHRGRRDERARRRRSPLALLTVSLASLAGAGMLAVSAWQGSFAAGGAVVDDRLATAAQTAQPTIQAAAQDATSALRQAGREAKTRAQDLVGG